MIILFLFSAHVCRSHWHGKIFPPFFGCCVDKKSNKGFHLYHYTWSNTFSRESERRQSGRWNYHLFCLFCIFRPFSADPSINRSDITEHCNGFTIKRFLLPLESFSSFFVVAWFHSRQRSPEMLSFLKDDDKIIGSFICRQGMVNRHEREIDENLVCSQGERIAVQALSISAAQSIKGKIHSIAFQSYGSVSHRRQAHSEISRSWQMSTKLPLASELDIEESLAICSSKYDIFLEILFPNKETFAIISFWKLHYKLRVFIIYEEQ